MNTHPPRTIIVTGGIVSGIGKGITAASLGRLFINRGISVAPVKIDPYLNTDAGTMNPFQHGEVFVTEDGHEADLDLGHYERFLNINVTKRSNFTSGAVYQSVMERERDGEYLGQTIQIIPHVTDEVKRRVYAAGEGVDLLTVELGGTIGDIEALPFIEAMRQYREEHHETTAVVHVVKMDYLYPSEEAKTKPIQHSVITLRSYGLQPDMLIVRCKEPLGEAERQKIAMFTGVALEAIIEAPDAASLYDIPQNMEKAGAAAFLEKRLGLTPKKANDNWDKMVAKVAERKGEVLVGMVGKYTQLSDAYLSLIEAVEHAGIALGVKAKVVAIDSEDPDVLTKIKKVDAVIIPGGFGLRGIEGKISVIKYVREKHIPFLGICLGLQLAVVEYARNVLQMADATSIEFDENASNPIVTFLPGQEMIRRKGGTMRLGSYQACLTKGTLAEKLYKEYRPSEINKDRVITERHRHRYEVNPSYVGALQDGGLVVSGLHGNPELVEFVELPPEVHPYFIATQAHPEFRSRPEDAHPLFAGLVKAALKK